MELVVYMIVAAIGLVITKLITDDSYDAAVSDRDYAVYQVAVIIGIIVTFIMSIGMMVTIA